MYHYCRAKFDPMFDDPELDNNGALSGFKALTARIKKAPPPSESFEANLSSPVIFSFLLGRSQEREAVSSFRQDHGGRT